LVGDETDTTLKQGAMVSVMVIFVAPGLVILFAKSSNMFSNSSSSGVMAT